MQIKTIIAAIDLQENSNLVADMAVFIAQNFEAALHLVHVILPGGTFATTHIMDPLLATETTILPISQEPETQMEAAREQLNKIAENISFHSLTVKVLMGLVEDELIDYAKEIEAGMLIVGKHRRSGISRLLNGETSVRILHDVKIPILVIPTL